MSIHGEYISSVQSIHCNWVSSCVIQNRGMEFLIVSTQEEAIEKRLGKFTQSENPTAIVGGPTNIDRFRSSWNFPKDNHFAITSPT